MKPKRHKIWITRDSNECNYRFWRIRPKWSSNNKLWLAPEISETVDDWWFEAAYPKSWHLEGGRDSIIEIEIGEAL